MHHSCIYILRKAKKIIKMADTFSTLGISKEILYAGKGEIPDFDDGCKVTFHFKTLKADVERTEVDCSKNLLGDPFELLIGKKFKLEIWELCIKSMKVDEIARFTCDKSVCTSYPIVSKTFRDMVKKKNHKHDHGHDHDHGRDHGSHTCSMAAFTEQGMGYQDLNDLMKNPVDLIFEIQLLKFERAGGYEKEAWQMSSEEKLNALPKYKEEGNKLFSEEKYSEAAEKYAEALGCLEQLCLNEKPGDKEWTELDVKKIPFLLNYSQCKLLLGDYYDVIKHCTTVLDKDGSNVKALFRRAKAYAATWSPQEAREDYTRASELDASIKGVVKKALLELDKQEKEYEEEQRKKLQGKGMFSS